MEVKPMRSALTSRRGQSGNAYIVTVMVMIIVTLLGLSLGAVTQTEMLIGSRERNNQRVFFLAESGLNIAVSRFMVTTEQDAARLEWDLPPAYDLSGEGGFAGISMKGVSRLAPVPVVWSNYCQLCCAGSLEYTTDCDPEARRYVFTVRSSMRSASGQILAERRVSSLLDIMPWDSQDKLLSIDSQVADIEFD
jgi:hypothetical protein